MKSFGNDGYRISKIKTMKIKLLIILAFLPLITFGQYQTSNLDFLFNGSIAVNGSDTLMVDSITGLFDVDYVLTNVDFDITLGYIPSKTNALLNGQSVRTFFENANYTDTAFTQWLSQTIDTDSTEVLPKRMQRYAHYSSATTDVNNFFQTPAIATVNVLEVGVGKTYTTIAAANSAAGSGDSIYVYDGDYLNAGGHYITKAGTYWKAVGKVKIVTSASQFLTLGIDNDTIKWEGFEIDGGGTNTYGIYILSEGECEVKDCYVSGNSNRDILNRGTGTSDLNTIDGVSFNTSATVALANQDVNAVNQNCYFGGSATVAIRDDALAQNYTRKIYYNDFRGVYSNYRNYDFQAQTINAKFNKTRSDSLTQFVFDLTVTDAWLKTITLEGNDYQIEASGDASGFVNSTTRDNTEYIIDNNTVVINDRCSAINFIGDQDLTITNNNIVVQAGGTVTAMLDDDPSLTMTISNNTFDNTDSQNDEDFTVNIVENTPNDIRDFTLIFEENLCRNGLYFGNAQGGHANLFIGNVPNSTVKHNYFQGSSIGGVIVKGFTGTSTGITSSTVLFNNIFDEVGIFVKGIRGVEIFQNTIKNDTSGFTGIVCIREASLEDSDSLKAYNNIISQESGYPYQFDTESFVGVESENNVLYGNADTTALISSTAYNWSGWQGLSLDLNGFNTNPNFQSSTQLWPIQPSNAIAAGLNLGTTYNLGLNTQSVWPNNVITTTQFSRWSIGAYVVPIGNSILHSNGAILIGAGNSILIFNR